MEQDNKNEKKKVSTYKTKTTTIVSLRLLNSDIYKLNTIALKTNVGKSMVLRKLIEGNPIEVIEYNNETLNKNYDAIINYLNKTGNNINQIAAKLDRNEILKQDDIELLKTLSEKLTALQNILNKRTTIKTKL
ncbi:TPA: hypothetical protein ACXNED_002559 [Pseudomonas aeruginosa]